MQLPQHCRFPVRGTQILPHGDHWGLDRDRERRGRADGNLCFDLSSLPYCRYLRLSRDLASSPRAQGGNAGEGLNPGRHRKREAGRPTGASEKRHVLRGVGGGADLQDTGPSATEPGEPPIRGHRGRPIRSGSGGGVGTLFPSAANRRRPRIRLCPW